jgi:sugar phosphate isomerase/epimerase
MRICAFSKHFQTMDARQLGRTMKDLGVPGVDLTVRQGGHVEPGRVESDLPRFQEALAESGVEVTMLTTAITSADEPYAVDVIRAAGQAGIRYLKLGYWRYEGFGNYRRQEQQVKAALGGLEPVLRENNVRAGLHTHSGMYMGLNAEFALRLVEDCDPQVIGIYYDTGHNAVEGAIGGWVMGLDLIADRLIMVALKDYGLFRMGSDESPRKGWRDLVVPLDSGMFDWTAFLCCLKTIGFDGPISFHSEYQGAYSFRDLTQEQVVEQTRRDLAYFRALMGG